MTQNVNYSYHVKEELLSVIYKKECCKLAELCGIVCYAGNISHDGLRIVTEKETIAMRANRFLKRIFEITGEITPAGTGRGGRCVLLSVRNKESVHRLLVGLSVTDEQGNMRVNPDVFKSPCCLRAFVTGAFLACGYIRDPAHEYRLEFICPSPRLAEDLARALDALSLHPLSTKRGGHPVLYFKKKDAIIDMLTVLGPKKAIGHYFNTTLENALKAKANRDFNADIANTDKMLKAQYKQLEAIHTLQTTIGLSKLPPKLRETAQLRLENQDTPFDELAAMHRPPISKASVSRRFQQMIRLAKEIKP